MKKNTFLGVDVKTVLQSDGLMKTGKDYRGVLRRDFVCDEMRPFDEHLTFVETAPSTKGKRNPKIFEGKHVSFTRQDDGSPRVNLKRVGMDKAFSVRKYLRELNAELIEGFNAFVENP